MTSLALRPNRVPLWATASIGGLAWLVAGSPTNPWRSEPPTGSSASSAAWAVIHGYVPTDLVASLGGRDTRSRCPRSSPSGCRSTATPPARSRSPKR